jgi:hypothetical protein
VGYYRNLWRFYRNDACLLERNHGGGIDLHRHRAREYDGRVACSFQVQSKAAAVFNLHSVPLVLILNHILN